MRNLAVPGRWRAWAALGIALGLILTALVAGGPSAGAAAAGPDNLLRFWYALPVGPAAAFDALLHQYAQAHPEIRLEARAFPTMDALRQALLDPSEPPPHLALIDPRWQDALIPAGRLTAAEDQMNRTSDIIRISMKADTFPAMWDAVQHDGKAWSVPAFGACHALLYDADMLKAAHLKRPPHAWGEMIACGKKLHHQDDTAGEVWGFALPLDLPSGELGELFDTWVEQAGEKSSLTDATRFQDPEHLKAMQFWTDLIYKYKVAPPDAVDPAHAAMFIGTEADLLSGQATGRHLEAMPLPSFRCHWAVVDVYSVALGNVDPDREDRAWQMASWVCDFPQLLTWTTEAPYLPANKQVTVSPGFNEYMQAHPGLLAFRTQMVDAHADPSAPGEREALGDALKSVATRHVPVAAALAAAAKKAQGQPAPSPAPAPGGQPVEK